MPRNFKACFDTYKSWFVWSAILAVLTLVLCAVPLFNLLAYEFCLVLSPLVSIAALHLGVRTIVHSRREPRDSVSSRSSIRELAAHSFRSQCHALGLLVIPLCLILLNGLRVKNCDPLEGVAFFLIMPCASATISATIGTLWGACISRPWLALLMAYLTFATSLGVGLYALYQGPAIFAYDPFVGYFPGALYDEEIAIHSAFYWYRLYNVVWIVAAFLCVGACFDPASLKATFSRHRLHRRIALVALVSLTLGIVLYTQREELEFASTEAWVRSQLGGYRRTDRFDIIYPAHFSKITVDRIVSDHEFRYDQLSRFFAIETPRVRSFIFATSEQKRRLMGAAQTYFARPWKREVYLQHSEFPHPVLKHELAHAFASVFGEPLLGISFLRATQGGIRLPIPNMGLIEGLAVAADWSNLDGYTVHEQAAALRRLQLAPPLTSLLGASFYGYSGARAYTISGSFCRFLVERYGIARMRDLYRNGGNFDEAYRKTMTDLISEWETWIDKLPLAETQLQLARETFRRPAIFHKVCAHEIANLRKKAGVLKQANRFDDAVAVLQQICSFDEGDPTHTYSLMNMVFEAGNISEALALKDRIFNHPSSSEPLKRATHVLAGDIAWHVQNLVEAHTQYTSASRFAATESARRILALKRWALDLKGTDLQPLLRDYLLDRPGEERDPLEKLHLAYQIQRVLDQRMEFIAPDPYAKLPSALGNYFIGKILVAADHPDHAISFLRNFIDDKSPTQFALNTETDPSYRFDALRTLRIEALRTLGESEFLIGHYDQARDTYTTLLREPDLTEGLRLDATDWIERATWAQRRSHAKR